MIGPTEADDELPMLRPAVPHDINITPTAGDIVTVGEGLIVHVFGSEAEGIRTSDSRGWTASGDVKNGVVDLASATGKPSHGEHLTVEASAILVRRLNQDGASWGDPVELDAVRGGGDDCEAPDTRDPRLPRLRVQVTRPKIEDFWKGLDREAKADMPPGTSEQAAQALWAGIDGKRLAAHQNVVLAVNTIRAPWLALRPVVEAFRRKYSADAQQVGFKEIWVVGASEAFTQRLDVVPNA